MHRILCLLAGSILLLSIGGASAHPHVWVIMKCKLIFNAAGSLVALEHSWSFDEMTSTFAIQGTKGGEGVPTREELTSAARAQIASLSQVGYFTTVLTSGTKSELANASDYWLEFDGTLLTLHFALAVKRALTPNSLTIELFDPSYFVDTRFADESPVELVQAPRSCRFSIVRQSWTDVANKIVVTCDGT
jgi:ABC-type uncharacterized transport system substrate-binding protein